MADGRIAANLLVVVALAMLAGGAAFILSAGLTAPYEARALLHVGGDASHTQDRTDVPRSAAVEQLRAPQFLLAVIREHGLTYTSAPDYLPLAGYAIARVHAGPLPAEPFLGRQRRAFGGERLDLDIFALPEEHDSETFTLIAGAGQSYTLLDASGVPLANGEVGRRVHAPAVSLRLRVRELAARPSTRFYVTPAEPTQLADRLRQQLKLIARPQAPGLLQIVMRGDSMGLLKRQLDAIVTSYMEHAWARERGAISDRTARVTGMIEDARRAWSDAEAVLEQWRRQQPEVSLAPEALNAIEVLVALDESLQRALLRKEAGVAAAVAGQPVAEAGTQLPGETSHARDMHEALIESLEEPQQHYASLISTRELAFRRYLALMEISQELDAALDAGPDTVRLIERTVVMPVGLVSSWWLALVAAIAGGLAGGWLCWWRGERRQYLASVRIVEVDAGAPVVAVVPSALELNWTTPESVCAGRDGIAFESIRSLAVAAELMVAGDRTRRVFSLAGASPLSGARAVTFLLARALAARDRRVLLLDEATQDPTGPARATQSGVALLSEAPAGGEDLTAWLGGLPTAESGVSLVNCEAASDEAMRALVASARGSFDLVLIAAGVTRPPPDTIVWLVARCAVDNRTTLVAARNARRRSNTTLHGAIVTGKVIDVDAYFVR